jgi:hypothetical protein
MSCRRKESSHAASFGLVQENKETVTRVSRIQGREGHYETQARDSSSRITRSIEETTGKNHSHDSATPMTEYRFLSYPIPKSILAQTRSGLFSSTDPLHIQTMWRYSSKITNCGVVSIDDDDRMLTADAGDKKRNKETLLADRDSQKICSNPNTNPANRIAISFLRRQFCFLFSHESLSCWEGGERSRWW